MTKKLKFVDGNMIEYEIYKLVNQYDPILRQPTQEFDFTQMVAADTLGKNPFYISMSLMESCNHYNGLGLSANQVGLPYRMCAISMTNENKVWCLFNPKLISKAEVESHSIKEGCLSFPGLILEIKRSPWCIVEFQIANGGKMTHKFEGIDSSCVLHELDHLDGICFTDRISKVKLDIAKRKVTTNLRKYKRAKKAAALTT